MKTTRGTSDRRQTIARMAFLIVAAFYAYGSLVHILNMLSLSGFQWPQAPFKWQVLDVVYLVLDLMVCIGFVKRLKPSLAAFGIATISQILLYTLFREWILEVPQDLAAQFEMGAEQRGYLTSLVIFHVVSLIAIALAWPVDKERWGTDP